MNFLLFIVLGSSYSVLRDACAQMEPARDGISCAVLERVDGLGDVFLTKLHNDSPRANYLSKTLGAQAFRLGCRWQFFYYKGRERGRSWRGMWDDLSEEIIFKNEWRKMK